MGLTENIDELQEAARYVVLGRTMRPGGIGSIVFGALAIMAGASTFTEDIISVLITLLGVFLLVEGILVVSSPRPRLLIVEGIAILLVGVSNILLTWRDLVGAEPSALDFFFFLGMFQLYVGIKTILSYKRFADLSKGKPSAQILGRVKQMVKALGAAGPKFDDRVVEFLEKVGYIDYKWKGKLMNDAALFMKKGGGQDVLIASKNDVNFVKQDTPPKRGRQEAGFQISEKMMFGTISPDHLERYESWKAAQTDVSPDDYGLVEIPE